MARSVFLKPIPYMRRRGLYQHFYSIGVIRMLAFLLFPVLLGMIMKRNDRSIREDLYCLFIFISCAVAWWYLTTRKTTPMPNYESRFSWRARLKSFTYAGDGLRSLFRTEHNAWIHFVLTAAAITLGFVLGISRGEWLVLVITLGLVWMAELFNTCIEKIMDFISTDRHPQIKIIKDLAAAAVLVSALVALAVGFLIFIPKLLPLW